MKNLIIPFNYNGHSHSLELAFVAGTAAEDPFLFGDELPVNLPDFYIAATPTTQALWKFIMGDEQDRSRYKNDNSPVEHVSWFDARDFIAKLNDQLKPNGVFRLPSETEWEYAARGGKHWQEGVQFAATNDINEAGWYEGNAGPHTDIAFIRTLKNQAKQTTTHPVGQKKPNQLGVFDMNGNVWEWCQDWYVPDTANVPQDGSAYNNETDAKVLRGGCHHNWAIHCTNTKRYAITPEAFDECIGFRVAFTPAK